MLCIELLYINQWRFQLSSEWRIGKKKKKNNNEKVKARESAYFTQRGK